MPKPTQEELDDEEQRSRPVAYFNFAETYWAAAKALRRSKTMATHKESPIRFLYYHAIEIYLKAHLRAHGIHPYNLRTSFGHRADRLSKKCEELGLFLMDEDIDIIRQMSETDAVIRSRYILTGSMNVPTLEGLERTCKSLRQSVGGALRQKGEPIRMSVRRKKRPSAKTLTTR